MKRTYTINSIIFFLLLLFCGNSCMSIKEELWANEDGSGKYHMAIDMSQALDFIGMMGGMEDDQSEDETEAKDPMSDIFKRIEKGTFSGDTIINSNDLIAESKAKGEENDIPKDMKMKVHYDKEKSEMDITFMFDFKSLVDLNKNDFFSGDKGFLKEMGGPGTDAVAKLDYSLDKKKFVRKGIDMSSSNILGSKGDDGSADMMMGLFSNTTFTSVYHLPQKVKSANNPDAVIDGKTVTIEIPMKELMAAKKTPDLEVKFKRKKFLGIF